MTTTTTTTTRTKMLPATTALVAAAACAPSMDPPSLLETTRLLGARVEVAGEAGRATPRPGETATVTWLVAAPGAMPPLGWAFVLCPGVSTSLDCAGAPLTVFQGQDQPQMAITVPAAADLGATTMLVLEGRVCSSSAPVIDGTNRARCTDDGDGTTASVAIPLDLDVAGSEANQNPDLRDSPLTLDGAAWDPASATDTADPCAGLPAVGAGTKDHVISVVTRGADREDYTALLGDPPAPMASRERLELSQFTTAGKLSRSFSWVEAEEPSDAPVTEVKWDAPAEARTVQLTFVVRDMRGGVDWTTRAVCVTQ